MNYRNIVIHIPHSSDNIPEEVMNQFILSASELDYEILRMTDHYTNELFDLLCATRLVYPFSRLVADPERFREDSLEPMSARGMGAVYVKTADGSNLRSLSAESKRESNLQNYYDSHHREFTSHVNSALSQHGSCLIIDAHSFPSSPLPCDMNQDPNRPSICIGTDSFHTSSEYAEQAVEIFRRAGWITKQNDPYMGAIVPNTFYKKTSAVSSIMVEVNKKLYMDETTGAKLASFSQFRDRLQQCLLELCETYERMYPGK